MNDPTPANPSITDNLLFEHFATLATAPDGIARLRELILQLAVQGKLGTQDAGDEPASKLLEKIRKDRERLAKERKNNKEKALEPKGGLSYSLPKTWISSPLGAIISIEYGESLPGIKREDSGKVPVYGSNGIVGYHSKAITNAPALIIGRKGSVGAIQISKVPCHPIDTAYFFDNFENLDCMFIFYLLTSLKLDSLDKSTAIPGLNRNDAYNLLVGLPPLAEQHRIVAKVDRRMALCDELATPQQEERAGCLKLGTASLAGLQNAESPEEFGRQWAQVCDSFDLILDCPENVAVLRQTILHLAVQGRLVRQEPGDEPVGKLFEKIQKIKKKSLSEGKIQNDKKFSPVMKDTPPWSIPQEWQWVRLQDIFEITRGGSPRPSGDPQYFGGNIPWITVGELTKDTGKFLTKVADTLTEAGSERSRFVDADDLLLTNSGATLGVPKISKIQGCINDGVAKLGDFHNLIDHEYAYYFLFQQTTAFRDVNQGMGQPNLNTAILAGWFFPLPPFAEQHRIVAKVDALMALCDALESRLKERAGMQSKFADAVVKNVGTG
jgi:type I restriction enzyme S subunit